MTGRALLRSVGTVLLLGAVWAGASAGTIALKAQLAQYLLERAWQHSAAGTEVVRPWPWADSWPAARLSFPRQATRLIVLEGASGRNLAFGPAHVTRTPWPGAGSSTLIAGHRDTHFRLLEGLEMGDGVDLERSGETRRFRVVDAGVVHQDAASDLEDYGADNLLLVTCYPFDAVDPGSPWRYVVRAVPSAQGGERDGPYRSDTVDGGSTDV